MIHSPAAQHEQIHSIKQVTMSYLGVLKYARNGVLWKTHKNELNSQQCTGSLRTLHTFLTKYNILLFPNPLYSPH